MKEMGWRDMVQTKLSEWTVAHSFPSQQGEKGETIPKKQHDYFEPFSFVFV